MRTSRHMLTAGHDAPAVWRKFSRSDSEAMPVKRRAGVPPARRARERERVDKSAIGFTADGRRDACPTLRFMGSHHDFDAAHWDHDPVAIPLTRPSDTLSPSGG